MPHVCAINRCQSRNFNGSQFNCGRSVTLSIHGLASAEWSHSGPGPGLVGQPQTSSYPGNIIFTHRKCILYSSINNIQFRRSSLFWASIWLRSILLKSRTLYQELPLLLPAGVLSILRPLNLEWRNYISLCRPELYKLLHNQALSYFNSFINWNKSLNIST